MKTRCERPYSGMIAAAKALRNLPTEADASHVAELARELAAAVVDLDLRMRAGLIPPQAWREIHPGMPPESTRGRYVLPDQPPVGTVVTPAYPSAHNQGWFWRRCAGTRDGAQNAGWVPDHHPTAAAESWLSVLRDSAGAVRVLRVNGSPAHTLAWNYVPPG